MPFNSISSFQPSTFPHFKYDLKPVSSTNAIYSLNNAFKIYRFNQSGAITFSIDNIVNTDSFVNKLNYCIVGGGGGGSGAVNVGTVDGVVKYAHGSGGGGGQVKTGGIYICSIDNLDKQEAITVTVGNGGAGTERSETANYPKNTATDGSPSSIVFSGYNSVSSSGDTVFATRDSIISKGGIGGKTLLGGSSGGDTFGGISNLNNKGSGGGGGSDPNKGGYGSINAGNGGAGTYNKIFGGYLGGGGGGGVSDYFTSSGLVGKGDMSIGGGSGNGGSTTAEAVSGYANYGGGGGGGGGGYGGNYDGGAGGSGVVLLWVSY